MADEPKPQSNSKALRVYRKLVDARQELKTAKDKNATLEADLAKRPTAESVSKLQGKLDSDRHRAAFNTAAKAAGIPEDRIEAAWKLSGHKPEGDVDTKALKAAIDTTLEAHKFLKAEASTDGEGADGTTQAPAKLPKGEGHAKGGNDKLTGGLKVTQAQLANAEWARANRSLVNEHVNAGTFSILEV